jgi:hypothetical protein
VKGKASGQSEPGINVIPGGAWNYIPGVMEYRSNGVMEKTFPGIFE